MSIDASNATGFAALLGEASAGSRVVTFRPGTVIYDVGDPATDLMLIWEGEVRCYVRRDGGAPRLIEILGPGDWFGIATLAARSVHQVRTVAIDAVKATALPVKGLRSTLMASPEVALALIQTLSERLILIAAQSALVSDDTSQRLVRALLLFGQSAAATRSENQIVLRMTHDQLAQAIGAARETISSCLSQLRQQKLVHTGRNKLTFDPEVLRRFGERLGRENLPKKR